MPFKSAGGTQGGFINRASCHAKSVPLIFISPQSKYIEIFVPPGTNFLIYLGPFEIFYPPLNLHSTHCVKGDNLFHL